MKLRNEYHYISFKEVDGWDIAVCDCGWESPPCPGKDIAADFYADHYSEE